MGRLLLTFVLLCAATTASLAQSDYPSKPIRMLVPFPLGGSAETFARVTAQRLQERWNAQVIVEPRPGAGGIIATEIAAKAPADGYTFIIVTVGHAVNPSLHAKLPYDTLADFTTVGLVAMSPSVLVVHPSVPARTPKELIALAKAKPGQLNYGTGGNATTAHVSAAMLASLTGIVMTHVPYKGAPLALQDLLGGRLELMIDQIPSSLGFIRNGRLRALAVSPATRTMQLPDTPTLAESGVPGYDFTAWWLFLAPAKTPPEIVAKFNEELRSAATEVVFRERLAKVGADPAPAYTPADANGFVKREVQRFAKVVKDSGMKVQ